MDPGVTKFVEVFQGGWKPTSKLPTGNIHVFPPQSLTTASFLNP